MWARCASADGEVLLETHRSLSSAFSPDPTRRIGAYPPAISFYQFAVV
jgi:hypothetical protein